MYNVLQNRFGQVLLYGLKLCLSYLNFFFFLFTEGDNVEVDESLFQDLEDLDIGDADIDIED